MINTESMYPRISSAVLNIVINIVVYMLTGGDGRHIE